MIAPRQILKETELYLYTNELEAGVFGIETETMPVDTTLNIPRDEWWAVWCFEIILTDPDREELLVLFMNVDSGVSLLVPGKSDNFDGLIRDFETGFIELLQENGAELDPTIDFKLTLM